MRITIMGIQASGKGVQGRRLADDLRFARVVIGDLVRQRAEVDDEVGRRTAAQMALGELVDESLAVQLLAVRLGEVSLSGFVLDGFPRSGPQVETLDAMLAHLGVSLDAAVHLSLDEKVARNRIADRLVCSLCKNSTSRLVVAAGSRCPSAPCRGMVSPRADDQDEAAINMRLSEFRELTRPVIDKYRAAGRLIEIDASREEVAVYAELRSRLSAIAATA